MKNRKILSAFIAFFVILIVYLSLSPQLVLEFKNSTYESMMVEIMSVPKDTIIQDEVLGKSIIDEMHIEDWDKQKNFKYEFTASRIIINIDNKYVYWVDKLDETTELCKVTLRHSGYSLLTGWYEIPEGTIEELELILSDRSIEWRNLN